MAFYMAQAQCLEIYFNFFLVRGVHTIGAVFFLFFIGSGTVGPALVRGSLVWAFIFLRIKFTIDNGPG